MKGRFSVAVGFLLLILVGAVVLASPWARADGAWGTFSGPFSGHLINTNGTRGRAETKFEPSTNRVYRWYCSNPIRFQKSLKIEIQNEDWVECFNDFTSVSFWYQEGAQGVTLAPLAERVRESMPELQQEESK